VTTHAKEGKPMNTTSHEQEITTMLLQEDLARARMRESQRFAAEWRLARRLSTVGRWRRLAAWANRHATEASRSL
jgi:hypothetical protein